MNKLEQMLTQIRARIKELEAKAKHIESLLAPVEEPVVVKPRRGRRKMNETV